VETTQHVIQAQRVDFCENK